MSARSIFPLLLAMAISTPHVFAASQEVISYESGKTYNLNLAGETNRTLYREEQYETTCYREESYTAYREVCDTGYETSCHSVPSCTDVNRPVCSGSGGCTDYYTRECTTSESCSTSSVSTNCRSEPYTAYTSVPYSCTQTRMVAYGTELVQRTQAEVKITFIGELANADAAETFKVEVANGLDVSMNDLTVSSLKSKNEYLYLIRELVAPVVNRSGSDVSIKREFVIESKQVALIISQNSIKMTKMKVDRQGITAQVQTSSLEGLRGDLYLQRDRRMGKHKDVFVGPVRKEAMAVTPTADGAQVRVNFAQLNPYYPVVEDFKKRPYLFGLTLSLSYQPNSTDAVLNSGANDKIAKALKSKKIIKVKFN
jgi:hypothetical protein